MLRGAALARGLPFPDGAAARREAWAAIGVLPDSVSSTCLVWRLPLQADGGGRRGHHLDTSSPFHTTWWHVRSGLRVGSHRRVLVCENPRVLEAAAEADVTDLAVVCTSGRPNLVTMAVLDFAASSASSLLYHGDFDWPGVAMANDASRRWGTRPVQMSVTDYDAAPGTLSLRGQPVEPGWDAELGASMRRRGVAVHEEAVLDRLLDHLA